jgi:hypothetical protein
MPLAPQTLEGVVLELALREDKQPHLLPGPDDPPYEFSGRYYKNTRGKHVLNAMSDAAAAAENALVKVFNIDADSGDDDSDDDGKLLGNFGTCSRHAGGGYFDNSKQSAVYRDSDANKLPMKADFHAFTNCPHLDLVDHLLDAMAKHWRC